jgi:hypothetical protein
MMRSLTWPIVLLAILTLVPNALSQTKNRQSILSHRVHALSALSINPRQIDLGKTIDSDAKRIALTLRAADLMWPAEQDKARATFSDAFDVATRLFKEKGAPTRATAACAFRGTTYR